MPIGAHLSTSKGFLAALQQAEELHCGCLQIFSKSPRQWKAKPLDPGKAQEFVKAWDESELCPLVVHDSYLINLAAPSAETREKSIAAMIDEVQRADMLGSDFLVTHCGSHLSKGEENAEDEGVKRLAQSLEEVLSATPKARVKIALENTCGQGTCLGGPFEQIAAVLGALSTQRLASCFDTCHAFAYGHDVSTPSGLVSTLKNFDETIGLKNMAVIHLNDSKGELGKHLDRHEHIGQGNIGREAMGRILTHPKLKDKPFILETPDVGTMVETNLETVRELQSS